MSKVKDQERDEQKVLTPEKRAEIIAWYKDQIELAELRERLAELQSLTVLHEAKRIQAAGMIAEMTTQPKNTKEDEN